MCAPFFSLFSGSIAACPSSIENNVVDTSSEPEGMLGSLADSGKSETSGTELERRAMVDDLSARPGSILDGLGSRCLKNRGNRAAAGLSALSGSIFDGFRRGGSEFVERSPRMMRC